MMRQYLPATLLSVLLAIGGCARGGSSSAERGQEPDNQTSAVETTESASSETSQSPQNLEPPGAPAVPDIADPEPTGWQQFDRYFEQLLVVHRNVIGGTMSRSDVMELQQRAEALSRDKSQDREASLPVREEIVRHVGDMSRASDEQTPEEQRIEMFRMVIHSTRDVLHSGGALPPGYIEKIENMNQGLESRLFEIRSKQ
jgi:hypothetical protein